MSKTISSGVKAQWKAKHAMSELKLRHLKKGFGYNLGFRHKKTTKNNVSGAGGVTIGKGWDK
jgi:hypothetical protein